jgi:hypothetical protein
MFDKVGEMPIVSVCQLLNMHTVSTIQMIDSLEGIQLMLMQLVRWLEKDDLLLYVTAVLGVALPGLVYLLYKSVDRVYRDYYKVLYHVMDIASIIHIYSELRK